MIVGKLYTDLDVVEGDNINARAYAVQQPVAQKTIAG